MIATKTYSQHSIQSPFGMVMPGRNWTAATASGYGFGFNGAEHDSEVKSKEASLDFGARIYDPRICRFLSIDPFQIEFPWLSHYCYAGNSLLMFIEANGLVIQFAENAQKETAMKIYQDIYDHADEETKAKLKVLENSDVVYLIDFAADLSDKKVGGENPGNGAGTVGVNFEKTSFDSNDPKLVIDISIDKTLTEYGQTAALADELETAHQFENNEFSFVTLPNNESGTIGYGPDDEAASQDASVEALRSLLWPLNEVEADWAYRTSDESFFTKYNYIFKSKAGQKGDKGLTNEELQKTVNNTQGISSIIFRKKEGDTTNTQIVRKQNK